MAIKSPKKKRKPSGYLNKLTPPEEHHNNYRNKRALVNPRRVAARANQKQILKMYSEGIPIEEIAVELDIDLQIVVKGLNSAIDRTIRHYAESSPQQTFVRYAAFHMALIQRFKKIYETFVHDDDSKQYTAATQALRSMSDMYDKILTRGVSFGVIEKRKADRKAMEGDARDLRSSLVSEIQQLQSLVTQMDEATSFQVARKVSVSEGVVEQTTFVRVIRKVLVDSSGVKQTIPDWKYRKKIFKTTADGKVVSVSPDDTPPEEKHLLPPSDPDAIIHRELAKEQSKELASQSNQSSKETVSPSPHSEWLVLPKNPAVDK
jgi:DNA invertase Pin-like site-specific DNA recombinase